MKVLLNIKGYQDEKFCSTTSSIEECEKLNITIGRCKLFKIELDYNFDEHKFERCEECLQCEVKEG